MSEVEPSVEPLPQRLPWQAPIWQSLDQARRDARLAHGLLLTGPRGVGKRHFARRLAYELLCERSAIGSEPCGECRSCIQLQAGFHPNAQRLSLLVDERTGKEKRDISVEQVRDLIGALMLSSHYGQARLVVIDPAEQLNLAASNALLKTLEEPPPGTHLLLISEQPQSLLPTLLSRLQRLAFATPSPPQASAWLSVHHPDTSPAALALAEGAPLLAVALEASGELARDQQWRSLLLSASSQGGNPLQVAAALLGEKTDRREQARAFLGWFQRLLHELLVAQAAAEGQGDPEWRALRARLTGTGIEALRAEAVEGLRRLASNSDPMLMVESLMILWWRWTRRTGVRASAEPRSRPS
ncbi:MAG TPA: hypothetical protein VFV27_10530 [Nevskiaceae bacterium]|nr:hypothetical protein [Nevskiaceae bacterium]